MKTPPKTESKASTTTNQSPTLRLRLTTAEKNTGASADVFESAFFVTLFAADATTAAECA